MYAHDLYYKTIQKSFLLLILFHHIFASVSFMYNSVDQQHLKICFYYMCFRFAEQNLSLWIIHYLYIISQFYFYFGHFRRSAYILYKWALHIQNTMFWRRVVLCERENKCNAGFRMSALTFIILYIHQIWEHRKFKIKVFFCTSFA